jgi:hypothetical protein
MNAKTILIVSILCIILSVIPVIYTNVNFTEPIKYHLSTYHDTVWVYNNNNLLIGIYVSKQNETIDSVL